MTPHPKVTTLASTAAEAFSLMSRTNMAVSVLPVVSNYVAMQLEGLIVYSELLKLGFSQLNPN